MSGFAWIDRHGKRHILDRIAPVEAELAEVVCELAAFEADLASDDEVRWEAALAASEPLVLRHNALLADLKRWNRHAAAANRDAAVEAVAAIDQLVADAGLIRLVHGHYADHERGAIGDGPASTSLLVLVRTVAVRHAIPVPEMTSATQAHAWLCARPETNRLPLAPAQATFAWVDRHGHTRQLRSLIELEREQLTLVGELASLRPQLVATGDVKAIAVALEQARGTLQRLRVLQGDAERWAGHVGEIRRQGARDRAKAIREMNQ